MNNESRQTIFCGYCGRLTHRCRCHAPESDLLRFMAVGERTCAPLKRLRPYKRAVPPQIKQRERQTLRRNYHDWFQRLSADYGERCANCATADELVLDHIVPIAKGGLSQLDNLQILCATCNRIKGKLAIDCRAFRHRGCSARPG